MRATDFGPDFVWGTATASYQIEGAPTADGKGESIWDRFSHTPGKIYLGENGDTACDFYHRYPEDIALLADLGLQAFRFSFAWPRILPEGTGRVNQAGLDFYHRIIDKQLELGIAPWATVYHWDLPQVLEDKGGWRNRDIVAWFCEYTEVLARAFGDKVPNWMVLNEPMMYTTLGYFMGSHAPGAKDTFTYMATLHHTALVQAEAARVLRTNLPATAQIGTTFSCIHTEPATMNPLDVGAAKRWDAMLNRLFIEPAVGMGYPFQDVGFLRLMKRYIKAGDEAKLAFDFDFHGIQTYMRHKIHFSLLRPFIWAIELDNYKRDDLAPEDINDLGWEIYPEGIYHLLKKFAAYPNIKKLIVTENGTAVPDTLTQDGRVHDRRRTKYYQDYLAQVLRAKREGVPVEGYFAWSFMDNFEWAEGYRPRFGLVYVDYPTQQRIIKDSGYWFQAFLKKS
jgi:beta-glucosidase